MCLFLVFIIQRIDTNTVLEIFGVDKYCYDNNSREHSIVGRLSLWNPVKTSDFAFIDRIVGEHLYAGGTGVHVHKYLGVNDVPETGDATRPGSAGNEVGEVFIQDLLFLENRDRKYDETIYELRGQYNIQDNDQYDLTQFGLFLANDTLLMNFHIESMVEQIGRKLMPGDVLELPHLRDDLLLGSDDAINRFYVVQEGARPAEGYDPRWWPHLWRVKLGPITDSQEYRDILGTGEEEGDLRNLVSKYQTEININDAILQQAQNDVKYDPQWRDTAHLYVDPDSPDKPTVGIDFAADGGRAPNGAQIVGSGATFPTHNVTDGDYFLRTDFSPHRLFQKSGTRWIKVSDDNRKLWAAANRVLTTFINNDNESTLTDGETVPEKTNLSQAIKPKTDD